MNQKHTVKLSQSWKKILEDLLLHHKHVGLGRTGARRGRKSTYQVLSICINSFRWWLQEAVWEKWRVCKAVIKAGVCFEESEIYFALLYFFLASHTNQNVLFHQFWWIPVNFCVRVDTALQSIKLEEKKKTTNWKCVKSLLFTFYLNVEEATFPSFSSANLHLRFTWAVFDQTFTAIIPEIHLSLASKAEMLQAILLI